VTLADKQKDSYDWERFLPATQLALNAGQNLWTHQSPIQTLLGILPQIPTFAGDEDHSIPVRSPQDDDPKTKTAPDGHHQEYTYIARKTAGMNLRMATDTMTRHYDKRFGTDAHSFYIGQPVWVYITSPKTENPKLQQKYDKAVIKELPNATSALIYSPDSARLHKTRIVPINILRKREQRRPDEFTYNKAKDKTRIRNEEQTSHAHHQTTPRPPTAHRTPSGASSLSPLSRFKEGIEGVLHAEASNCSRYSLIGGSSASNFQ
jgi:hypothetical protein